MPIATSSAVLTATIANGGTLSDAVDLGASTVCDRSGGTYATLKNINGVAATITVATVGTGAYLYIDPLITAGWPYIKLLSQAAEGAARAIKLLVRPV